MGYLWGWDWVAGCCLAACFSNGLIDEALELVGSRCLKWVFCKQDENLDCEVLPSRMISFNESNMSSSSFSRCFEGNHSSHDYNHEWKPSWE